MFCSPAKKSNIPTPRQVPEAKFSYDLSPMSVHVKERRRKWYDFLTSVLAIVGGTFTVVGVLDNVLFRVIKQKKI